MKNRSQVDSIIILFTTAQTPRVLSRREVIYIGAAGVVAVGGGWFLNALLNYAKTGSAPIGLREPISNSSAPIYGKDILSANPLGHDWQGRLVITELKSKPINPQLDKLLPNPTGISDIYGSRGMQISIAETYKNGAITTGTLIYPDNTTDVDFSESLEKGVQFLALTASLSQEARITQEIQ